jgi:hypothetical protein
MHPSSGLPASNLPRAARQPVIPPLKAHAPPYPAMSKFSESPFSPPSSIKSGVVFSFVWSRHKACSFIQGRGKGDLNDFISAHFPTVNLMQQTILNGPTIELLHTPPSKRPSPWPFGQETIEVKSFWIHFPFSFFYLFLFLTLL